MKMLTIALTCHIVPIPFLSTGQEVYYLKPFDQLVQVPFFLDNDIAALSKIGTILMVALIVTEDYMCHIR
jgi:hypothetical protein